MTETKAALVELTENEKAIVELVVQTVVHAMKPLRAKLAELTTKVAELEARPAVFALKDKGVWRPGREYREGDLTSFKGAGWICQRSHVSTSAFEHAHWRMFQKSHDVKGAS